MGTRKTRRPPLGDTSGLMGLLEALGEARRQGNLLLASRLHNELLEKLRETTEAELRKLGPAKKEEA